MFRHTLRPRCPVARNRPRSEWRGDCCRRGTARSGPEHPRRQRCRGTRRGRRGTHGGCRPGRRRAGTRVQHGTDQAVAREDPGRSRGRGPEERHRRRGHAGANEPARAVLRRHLHARRVSPLQPAAGDERKRAGLAETRRLACGTRLRSAAGNRKPGSRRPRHRRPARNHAGNARERAEDRRLRARLHDTFRFPRFPDRRQAAGGAGAAAPCAER